MATSNDTSERVGYVYLITNTVNGKQYVGKTICTIKRRWIEHVRDARRGSDTYLHRAIRKHGKDSFTLSLLEEVSDPVTLLEREIAWIAELRTYVPAGMNQTRGGDGGAGCSPNAETRAKIGVAGKGRVKSAEECANISAGKKGTPGRKKSPEEIARIRETSIKQRNTNGYPGVEQNIRSGRWVARMMQAGVSIYLGSFNTPEEAAQIYKKAKEDYQAMTSLS